MTEKVIASGLFREDITNNPFADDNTDTAYDKEIQKYIFTHYPEEVAAGLSMFEGDLFEEEVLAPILDKHYTPTMYKIVVEVPGKWDDEKEGE